MEGVYSIGSFYLLVKKVKNKIQVLVFFSEVEKLLNILATME